MICNCNSNNFLDIAQMERAIMIQKPVQKVKLFTLMLLEEIGPVVRYESLILLLNVYLTFIRMMVDVQEHSKLVVILHSTFVTENPTLLVNVVEMGSFGSMMTVHKDSIVMTVLMTDRMDV